MSKAIETLSGSDATAFRQALKPHLNAVLTEDGFTRQALDDAVAAAGGIASSAAQEVVDTVPGLVQPIADRALAAAGFPTLVEANTFAPNMTAGQRTTVSTTDTGTHAAVAGEVRLDGTAATVGEAIPNGGVYEKQAGGALLRVESTEDQLAGVQRAAADLAAQQATAAVRVTASTGRPIGAALVTGTNNTGNSFIPLKPAAEVRTYYQVRAFNPSSSARVITLRRATLVSGVWTPVAGSDVTVNLPAGPGAVSAAINFVVQPGEYPVISSASGSFTVTAETADQGGYYLANQSTTGAIGAAVINTRPQIALDYTYAAVTGEDYNATKAEIASEFSALEAVYTIGLKAGVRPAGSGSSGANLLRVLEDVSPYHGEIRRVRYEGRAVGTAYVGVYADDGTNITLVESAPVPVLVGWHEYDLPYPLKIAPGQHPGVFNSPAVIASYGNVYRVPGGNQKNYFLPATTGNPATFPKTTPNIGSRPQIGFDIHYTQNLSEVAAKLDELTSGRALAGLGSRSPVVPLAAADVPAITDVMHALFAGDSTSIGTESVPLYSTSTRYPGLQKTFGSGPRSDRPGNDWGGTIVTPGTTTMIDMIEFQDTSAGGSPLGETSLSALTAGLIERGIMAGVQGTIWFGSTAGRGGITLTGNGMVKGTGPYKKLIGHAQDACTLVVADGKTYSVPFIVVCIGDNETASSAPNVPQYADELRGFIEAVNVDIPAITGQTTPIHVFFVQTPRQGNRVNVMAITEVARTHRLAHVLMPTVYLPRPSDGIHYSTPGSMEVGAFAARAAAQLIFERREPDWLEPKTAWDDGSYIYCRFRVPVAPLRLNIEDLNWSPDFGLRVADDNGTVPISDIRIVDGDTVRVTPGRARVGTTVFRAGLDYYVSGVSTPATPPAFPGGSGANLSDSTPGVIAVPGYSQSAAHCCPSFQIDVAKFAAP